MLFNDLIMMGIILRHKVFEVHFVLKLSKEIYAEAGRIFGYDFLYFDFGYLDFLSVMVIYYHDVADFLLVRIAVEDVDVNELSSVEVKCFDRLENFSKRIVLRFYFRNLFKLGFINYRCFWAISNYLSA